MAGIDTKGGRLRAPRPAPRSGQRSPAASDRAFGYALIAPALVIVVAVILVPLGFVVFDSLTDRTFIRQSFHFVGLKNYVALLGSPGFWQVFGRSMVWTLTSVVLQIVIGFAFALLLNQKFRGRGVVRGLFLLPWVTPVVVIALVWKWMLNDLYGVVNVVLGSFNPAWQDISWFSGEGLALVSVIAINVWRGVPFTMIIFLSGLQTVPTELLEAASIDGASPRQRFWYITIPHLRAILFVVALVFTLFNFNNFDLIWLLTQGGPIDRTMTLPVKIYQTAFKGQDVGEASAWAILTLATILILSFTYMKVGQRRDEESR